jgi:hypothetical protein
LVGLVAQPGDPDLDCDVSGLTVTAVVAQGREILARLTGGHGRWTDRDTGEQVSGVVQVVTELQANFAGDMPEDLFAALIVRLERWRDRAVPLRMCAAPGRVSLLVADGGDFLPWPRRWPPPESEREPLATPS